MKISKRPQLGLLAPGKIGKLHQGTPTAMIDLQDYWGDTLVRRVFMLGSVIQAINEWVEESVQADPVPEVGGLLYGQASQAKEDERRYDLMIEQFFPLEDVERSTPRFLEFGTKTLQLTDGKLDQYPEMLLLAWFHTHPGHSPFLSDTDLHTHEGFFTQPFQIAIVLDSLTPEWDTGIFSRKRGGVVNNLTDKVKWIKWKQVDPQAE